MPCLPAGRKSEKLQRKIKNVFKSLNRSSFLILSFSGWKLVAGGWRLKNYRLEVPHA